MNKACSLKLIRIKIVKKWMNFPKLLNNNVPFADFNILVITVVNIWDYDWWLWMISARYLQIPRNLQNVIGD